MPENQPRTPDRDAAGITTSDGDPTKPARPAAVESWPHNWSDETPPQTYPKTGDYAAAKANDQEA